MLAIRAGSLSSLPPLNTFEGGFVGNAGSLSEFYWVMRIGTKTCFNSVLCYTIRNFRLSINQKLFYDSLLLVWNNHSIWIFESKSIATNTRSDTVTRFNFMFYLYILAMKRAVYQYYLFQPSSNNWTCRNFSIDSVVHSVVADYQPRTGTYYHYYYGVVITVIVERNIRNWSARHQFWTIYLPSTAPNYIQFLSFL